ncbi:MAG: adenosylmethionine--8-amino-7-oxononanoate transaminase [Candidatus Omnitrophica bacterium]|nr:adenosylmethionine--8-amino-7-oxononanoate transaminase [Candidatus Omnitrophota bacterium]
MRNIDLIKRDLKYNWHPFTQMKDCLSFPPVPLEKAKGVKLFDYNGKFYYDTISSWWCNVHGHSHPFIKKAIKRQLETLEHTLFAGFTHLPAITLSEKLMEVIPGGLNKIFYSDNGSTSVEVALKMSLQYWKNKGKRKRNKFVSLDMGYHGDTVGAMSVSGRGPYNSAFERLLFDTLQIPTPYCYRCPSGMDKDKCSFECLMAAATIFENHHEEISAVIIEPILLGAGGMLVYPVKFLRGISALASKYGCHLILDEVATGFGRTGRMFAAEHAGIVPDIMCLSKGITSGYLPIGLTVTKQEIYDGFYAEFDEKKTFYHGHTYTANPLACAAGAASLDLFKKEDSLFRAKMINKKLNCFLNGLKDAPYAGDVRSVGVVGAIEIVEDKKRKKPFDPSRRIGMEVYTEGLRKNLVLRPLGNVIYFFLPLSVKENELDDIFERSLSVFKKVFK